MSSSLINFHIHRRVWGFFYVALLPFYFFVSTFHPTIVLAFHTPAILTPPSRFTVPNNKHIPLRSKFHSWNHDLLLYDRQPSSRPSRTALSISIFQEQSFWDITRDQAEVIAGPFFGLSLFPYLLFLYFLNVPQNNTPKGVVVGFATCLLFVFLTIPAAIAAQSLYGVSLADSDWLHGSAESLLTITNIITVFGFRQALSSSSKRNTKHDSYIPMTVAVVGLTILAGLTAWIPATQWNAMTQVHFPYLGGWMDIPSEILSSFGWLQHVEPLNALTVECWIIHISSLIEFLIAMGFVCMYYSKILKLVLDMLLYIIVFDFLLLETHCLLS